MVIKMEVKAEGDRLIDGMRELLLMLPEDTLKSFLSTVTGYLVKYGSVPVDGNGKPTMDARTHAIQTILMYSEPIDLLGRQKMTRSVLSNYLNQKSVKMTTPPTKKTLCEDVLRHWGVQNPTNLTVRDLETDQYSQRAIKSEVSSQSQVPMSSSGTQTAHCSSQAGTQSSSTQSIQGDSKATVAVNCGNGVGVLRQNNTLVPTNCQDMDAMQYETCDAVQRQEIQLGLRLGMEFSIWYYERLNTLTDFTPAHFWPECNLRIEMILAAYGDNTIIDEIMGNADVTCAKLKDLVSVKQLYFNPNTSGSGVKGYVSPHGLAQVMVCGTLHQKETGAAVGVFEQMFGLMKDPRAGNTYKVKFTVLRLREGGHLAVQDSPPEICDSSLVGIIEEVDEELISQSSQRVQMLD